MSYTIQFVLDYAVVSTTVNYPDVDDYDFMITKAQQMLHENHGFPEHLADQANDITILDAEGNEIDWDK
jgi:hypothetical protein